MGNLTLGSKIQKRRKELNLTLKELSEKCGILPQLISDYENDRKEPGLKNLRALCDALEIYPNYLLIDSEYSLGNKTKTYGEALNHYLEALALSKHDTLIVDKENQTVNICINDNILKKVFLQIDDFLKIGGPVAETLKAFNINLLSSIEIKED